MNRDVERTANRMTDKRASTYDMIPGSIEQMQRVFGRPGEKLERELNSRPEEHKRKHARVGRESHDALLQDSPGASLLFIDAARELPAVAPENSLPGRALRLMRRVIDEGRIALQGFRSFEVASASLEHALYRLLAECTPGSVRSRIFVTGQSRALKPTIQQQVYLIGREALVNALVHSSATSIEAEVEYLPHKLRVIVRDNGHGIDPQMIRPGRDSHGGLLGIQRRARGIGAQIEIWSGPRAGTEIVVTVPGDIAADARAA